MSLADIFGGSWTNQSTTIQNPKNKSKTRVPRPSNPRAKQLEIRFRTTCERTSCPKASHGSEAAAVTLHSSSRV